jgi:hypothetical protein
MGFQQVMRLKTASSHSCAFLGVALASRRSGPKPVAGRSADISKAPEEVVPLEPNGLPPWAGH